MTFFEFLESSYMSGNIELQKDFTLYKQAETRAVQNLINAQRRVFTWLSYPKLVAKFFLVKLGVLRTPLTAKEIGEEFQASIAAKQTPKTEKTHLAEAKAPEPDAVVVTH